MLDTMLDTQKKTLVDNVRLRRNRKSSSIRKVLSETTLTKNDFVQPFFLLEGVNKEEAIPSMPGVKRFTVEKVLKRAMEYFEKGITTFALFPIISNDLKTEKAEEAYNPNGLIPNAMRFLKKELPEACFISDIALDPFTTHGHDGIIDRSKEVLNDPTLEILGKMALVQAEAGVDIVAPSDMMDGRVRYIREKLDASGFTNTSILSYSAKFASSFYGPFRDALHSQLSFGDKKTYQMDPANKREALLEALLDENESADILMVKPASMYLDIIQEIKRHTLRPVAAYHVSGEYSMIMAAHEKGYLDKQRAFFETLLSIKRAGADLIFTYAIEEIFPFL